VRYIQKVSSGVATLQLWIAILIVAFLTLSVFADIILRFVFSNPLNWVQEVASGSLIWITFLGAGALTRKNQHLKLDLITNRLSDKTNWVRDKIMNVLILFFAVVLVYYSVQLFQSQVNTPLGVLGVPRAYYFALPLIVFSSSIILYIIEVIFCGYPKSKPEETLEL